MDRSELILIRIIFLKALLRRKDYLGREGLEYIIK